MSDFEKGAEMVRDLSLAEETDTKGKFCSYCRQPFESSDDNPVCPYCRED